MSTAEQSSVQAPERVLGKAGHPGKKGTLRDLFHEALEGVGSPEYVKIAQNLRTKIEGVENAMRLQRNFKVQDVQVILAFRDYILSELQS